MDFIKIAICDDEKNIRAYLSSLVRKQGAECEIAEYASADEYLLDQTEYDLLFLDIELDGAASSMGSHTPPGSPVWIVNTFLDNFFKVVFPILYRRLIS